MLPQIWLVHKRIQFIPPCSRLQIVEKPPNFPQYHSSHKSRIGGNALGICDPSGICGNWFADANERDHWTFGAGWAQCRFLYILVIMVIYYLHDSWYIPTVTNKIGKKPGSKARLRHNHRRNGRDGERPLQRQSGQALGWGRGWRDIQGRVYGNHFQPVLLSNARLRETGAGDSRRKGTPKTWRHPETEAWAEFRWNGEVSNQTTRSRHIQTLWCGFP